MGKLMDDHLPEIRAQFETGRAVAIVGAGATIASTGSPNLSWVGLLREGIIEGRKFVADPGVWEKRLNDAMSSPDLSSLLLVGDEIERLLRRKSELGYFLDRIFKRVAISNRRLWEAIAQLGCRVATTNYDEVGEQVTHRRTAVWGDEGDVHAFIDGDNKILLHVHGFFRKPDTIVLGASSYKRHLRNKRAQFFQQLLPTLNSLIFIGFGEGLDDPNFSALLKWMGDRLKDGRHRHYRFCLSSQKAEYDRRTPDGVRIYNVAFGDSLAELPAFIETLAPLSAIPDGLRDHAPLFQLATAHLSLSRRQIRDDHVRGVYRNELAAVMAKYINDAKVPFSAIMKTRHEGLRAGLARAIGKFGARDDIKLLNEMAPAALMINLKHQILWGMYDLHHRHGLDRAMLRAVGAAMDKMAIDADAPLRAKIKERRSQLGLP